MIAPGLFLVSLAILILELVLTRIFSVTMWYHFAFLTVSLAMAGTAAGALAVRAFPGWFPRGREAGRMALCASGMAVAIPAALAVHVAIPLAGEATLAHAVRFAAAVGIMVVPFVLGGAAVCLALTRFPRRAAALYAADLGGAAAACPATLLLLERVDAPAAACFAAMAAAAGGLAFARAPGGRGFRPAATVVLAFLATVTVGQVRGFRAGAPLIRLTWVKNAMEGPSLYEAWNAHSRVRVIGDPATPASPPESWGLSRRRPPDLRIRFATLIIDGSAATPLMAFDGRVGGLALFRWETNGVVHRLRPHSRVLVIGMGGGRDVLAALEAGQPDITALEVNGAVLDAVNGRFGDLTGHLDRRPDVTIVHDEGRSWLARSRAPFRVIQVSLVDTWAASAVGALALTEHSLYTVEAWALFLSRLAPGGILTVSRYYAATRRPFEMYRLVALAAAGLRAAGIADPRRHLMVMRETPAADSGRDPDAGLGTVYASPTPFAAGDVARLKRLAADRGFTVPLTPDTAADPLLADLAEGVDPVAVGQRTGMTLDPPTDDRPYFFFTARWSDLLGARPWRPGGLNVPQLVGLLVLALAAILAATMLLPPLLTGGGWPGRDLARAGYFALIGLGFMGVEVAQIQRLAMFLGRPTLALSIALFALLLAGAAGSRAAGRTGMPGRWFAVLLVLLALTAATTGPLVRELAGAPLPVRAAAALALIAPAGFLMGGPWPLGMAAARAAGPSTLAWCWAVNGAASVLGPVAGYLGAMLWGIPAVLWGAIACYAAAGLLLRRL